MDQSLSREADSDLTGQKFSAFWRSLKSLSIIDWNQTFCQNLLWIIICYTIRNVKELLHCFCFLNGILAFCLKI
jgi:hypothetical protein